MRKKVCQGGREDAERQRRERERRERKRERLDKVSNEWERFLRSPN